MKKFTQAPLPFQGQKRKWNGEFKIALKQCGGTVRLDGAQLFRCESVSWCSQKGDKNKYELQQQLCRCNALQKEVV